MQQMAFTSLKTNSTVQVPYALTRTDVSCSPTCGMVGTLAYIPTPRGISITQTYPKTVNAWK